MSFFRVYQHILPNARAWRITIDKRLRQFFAGLALSADDVRNAYDLAYQELAPETTQSLAEWENLFGLPPTALTSAQRRDRLSAAWKTLGGQSPAYIQGVLRAAGFDVYVYEWFEDAAGTPRDPNNIIGSGVTAYIPAADSDAAHSGGIDAKAGKTSSLPGRFLINQRPSAELVPANLDDHKFIMYISGSSFEQLARIPANRRLEFFDLCLKICPAHLWIGLNVEYS